MQIGIQLRFSPQLQMPIHLGKGWPHRIRIGDEPVLGQIICLFGDTMLAQIIR